MRAGDPDARPVFFLHDATGDVLTSVRLARLLPGRRPVLGIRAGLTEDGHPADTSVEDMAASAVRLMRDVQPTGPYTVAGYSFGAIVALEAARQLEVAHAVVTRVVMLDPFVGVGCLSPLKRWWFLAVQMPWRVLRWLPSVDRAERRRFGRRVLTRLFPWTGLVLPPITETSPTPEMERLAATAVTALEAYRPRRLAAPVTILASADGFPCMCNPVPTLLGVADRAASEVMTLRGGHADMMREPDVFETAGLLTRALEDHEPVRRESRGPRGGAAPGFVPTRRTTTEHLVERAPSSTSQLDGPTRVDSTARA